MSAIGADPAQLDALATQFDGLAGELGHRRTMLNAWIEGDRFWRGARAGEFRHAWASEYSPQIEQAVQFLRHHVTQLHDNANQQRVASGEQPKDYGSGGFLNKLWGGVENTVSGVEHTVAHDVAAAAHGLAGAVKDVWDIESAGFKEVVGSKAFAEVLGVVQIVGTVAAFFPPPADAIALAAGGVVMVGHLAQMANRGKFDPAEFALDAAGVAGGGAALVLDRGAKAAVFAARVEFAANAGDSGARAAALVKLANDSQTIDKAIHDVKIGQGLVQAESTAYDVQGDLVQGHYRDAATDALLGTVGAAGTAAGTRGSELLAHSADAVHDGGRLKTDGFLDGLADLGGYEE